MCRRNLLWGCVMVAFGMGVLVGLWLGEGFWCHCFGFGFIVIGCGCFRRK